jgi:ERCC4-related helicase
MYKYNPILRFYHYSQQRPEPIEPFLHQVEILTRSILRDKIRVLIGDEIGLGKTITAIVVGKYLEDSGEAKRILVLVPRILLEKWKAETEYWVGSGKVQVIESRTYRTYVEKGFPEGWYLVSMDLLVRNEKVREALSKVNWDLIIVDEAHRLSRRSAKKRWSYIGKELIEEHPERHVILLSATPHKGFPDDYIAKLCILDPGLVEDYKKLDNNMFYKLAHNVLTFRRLKEDVNKVYEQRDVFKPAHLVAVLIKPTDLEAEFYKRMESTLLEILRKYRPEEDKTDTRYGQKWGLIMLLVTLLAKRAFSSPAAGYSTLTYMTYKRAETCKAVNQKEANRLRNEVVAHLMGDYTEETLVSKAKRGAREEDPINKFLACASAFLDDNTIRELEELKGLARRILKEGHDSKLAKLAELVKYYINEGSKIVVFTEYKETAYYIYNGLRKVIGDEILVLTGEEAHSKDKMKKIKDCFLREEGECKVLVSTDVLSEGLDLQVANVLINYDLPWSPLKLEQRMGRIWRLGQEKESYIYIFVVGSSEKATGSSRVVSVLYSKLLNMEQALGRVYPMLGEDVEVFAKDLSGGERERELLIAGLLKGEGKRQEHAIESDLIISSLDDNEFKKFVDKYVNAVKRMVNRVRQKNADPQPIGDGDVVKLLIETIGFANQDELRTHLLRLVRSIAKTRGVLKALPDGREYISSSYHQKTLQEMSIKELITTLMELLREKSTHPIPIKLIIGDDEEEKKLLLFEVSLALNGNKRRYFDIIGMDMEGRRIIRGKELLEIIASAIEKPHYVEDADQRELENSSEWVKSYIWNYLRRSTLMFDDLERVKQYMEKLNSRKLRKEEYELVKPDNIALEVKPLALIETRRISEVITRNTELLQSALGEYDEEKAELERKAIEILKNKLSEEFNIIDVHEKGWLFDLLLVKKSGEPREQRIVEVKTWKNIDVVIYTEGEKGFGEECENKGAEYWLYIVDLRGEQPVIKGFRRPLSSNALSHIDTISRNEKKYFIYRVTRAPDEEYLAE